MFREVQKALVLAASLICGQVVAAPVTVYQNDFSTAAGAGWVTGGGIVGYAPLGNYLGNFSGSSGATLNLSGLAAHSSLSLEFDLYLFSTWDGENTYWGKDYFSISSSATGIGGSWTFTNHQPQGQSYPGTPTETYGPGGSNQTHVYRDFGPTGGGQLWTSTHSASTFSISFGGPTTQADEWWGIDNIRVAIDSPAAVPEPGSIALLGLGLAGLAGIGRRRT